MTALTNSEYDEIRVLLVACKVIGGMQDKQAFNDDRKWLKMHRPIWNLPIGYARVHKAYLHTPCGTALCRTSYHIRMRRHMLLVWVLGLFAWLFPVQENHNLSTYRRLEKLLNSSDGWLGNDCQSCRNPVEVQKKKKKKQ